MAAPTRQIAPKLDGAVESRELESPISTTAKPQAPEGSVLTGKQEHYLKRELISRQTQQEISELASPTALQRFGIPFRSDTPEISSDLPLLHYIFYHHVRQFPFLDRAREKEFWQDKVQVFLESFAKKHISTSEDRLEETKRRKLALKAEKLVELMMVSGIPTASGYEERIRFSEMEVVDRGANEQGLVVNIPEGRYINGWDVNVAAVRMTSVKRTVRYHQHAEFILRVKQEGGSERFVGRRYGEFVQMHKRLRTEVPGKTLPPLPRKNKAHTQGWFSSAGGDDDADSISSESTQDAASVEKDEGFLRTTLGLGGHKRGSSAALTSGSSSPRPRSSMDSPVGDRVVLYREAQRVSLRASLRVLLQNERIAKSQAMYDFLSRSPIKPNREELEDVARRKEMDQKRIEDQKQFYEAARKRAKELDVHMEKFRRDIVERNGLSNLFKEIRQKNTIAELSPEYKKFAEWLRIEVAATIYHLFLAEDNSPELFAQARRIHSLVPYTALKNVIRFTNPAAVMKGVLDLFLAQPLGARSLMQRIFGMALNDGIRSTQKSIDQLAQKVNDPILCEKIKNYTIADQDVKVELHAEAADEGNDLVVVLLRTELFGPELQAEQVGRVFNAYVAWTHAVENIDDEMRQGAELFAHLKQLLRLHTRQRDKAMMMSIIEEPVTLQLFRDLFTIFYEPLVRVYKSANVYSSVTDFASFADDIVKTVDAAQRQDMSSDPNQTVQAFIDLCQRHEDDFYRFVHEVHIHDNGLFDQLMTWLERILDFLRNGPNNGSPGREVSSLDMNLFFQQSVDRGDIEKDVAIKEIDELIAWQLARKQWHQDKTRRKMAADAENNDNTALTSGKNAFKSSDFGINELDIQDLGLGQDDTDSEDDEAARDAEEEKDPIGAERRRRGKIQAALKSRAGEPEKPEVKELGKIMGGFVEMLRRVLGDYPRDACGMTG
ncbi:MAG: hypothetical protein M1828_006340 [Chrysothrix sp. TS-e1954]|nr:MAG: hypothetical protein M1828_006340 [Chrysothrix sp. TS-e1954]